MRRIPVLLLSIALVVVLGGGAAALARSSTASTSPTPAISTAIVCPLAHANGQACCGPPIAGGTGQACCGPPILGRTGQPSTGGGAGQPCCARRLPIGATPPCCGPTARAAPTNGGPVVCCPPNASCDFSRMIGAAPNPSTAGQQVVISGRLATAPSRRASSTSVLLWRRLPGWRRFHPELRTSTDVAGRYVIVRGPGVVQTNREWYVTAGPGAARTRTVHQRVSAAVTLSASTGTAAPGDRVSLSATVTPSHAGGRVELQRLLVGGWGTIARPRLARASKLTSGQSFDHDANVRLRVVLPGGARNIRSVSPVVTIAVRGIYKIKHVVVIMQENRSFDTYFGTYPGADGIPPGVCVPDPASGGCVRPFHNATDLNHGGPHSAVNATADINGGAMNGFVGQAEQARKSCSPNDPSCSPCSANQQAGCIDVMGYHDAREIPNYWTYAHDFVLQDHMYEPNASWSLPAHLFMVSEWSAFCTNPFDSNSCRNALQNPNPDYAAGIGGPSDGTLHYAWTDMTYLLHRQSVSWGYYVFKGSEPDCEDDAAVTCAPVAQGPQTPGIWNPLPSFTDVAQDNQLGDVQTLDNFYTAARSGTLPAVSWIDPNGKVSEHPPGLVSAGQTYTTGLINAIMRS
ncbi:MAG: alkaline phosphatase family protein, partial [Solirubrobacteraceae bacterium]